MFQYKNLLDIVFTKEKLFELISPTAISANCAWRQSLKLMLVSCQFVSEFWEAFLDRYNPQVSTRVKLTIIKTALIN